VALNVDSLLENMNVAGPNGAPLLNNAACRAKVGDETINFAFLTKNGHSIAPADPLVSFGVPLSKSVTPDPQKVAFFNSGDTLEVSLRDTPDGLLTVIHDLDSGETGSMTASPANGFAHLLFQPTATACTSVPYAFHPMYSTASEHTRGPWAAHSYNIAYSDEIGHFEYRNAVTDFVCTGQPNPTDQSQDDDDAPCFTLPVLTNPGGATVVPGFSGCVGSDDDFDGPEYQTGTWPGGGSGAVIGNNVSTPIQFTSPTFTGAATSGRQNYSRVAFETDLPRIEGSDFSTNNNCQRHVSNPADPHPGADCVNPPHGATFYPIYTTNTAANGSCIWQEGGAGIPGTTNTFGGTSTAEYGGLLLSNYPAAGFTITKRYNNFHKTLGYNPCPAS
jgi:hypothetical protein